ncbi:MAG: acyltransferase [Winogradskyella sp.]
MILILNIINKFKRRAFTLVNKLKYLGVLSAESNTILEQRVSIKPFFGSKSKLKVEMRKNSRIHHDVIIQGTGIFILGENSYISSYCIIGVNERIEIGRNVMIADAVSIRDTDHKFENVEIPVINQGIETSPIVIKDNVWIGYGAVITKGITINEGAIIAANAVVTRDVETNTIVGGVPAKVLRVR